METVYIYGDDVNGRYLDQAVEAMRNGEIIIYPTDTLYALGCDALNNRAVERICRLKDIDPLKQRLAIACSDLGQAARYAKIDNNAFDIMRRNLPGPFTFILPAATSLPKVFKGRKEVGVRIPADPIARALAEALGNPLLTTSIEIPADTHPDLIHVATLEAADRFDSEVSVMIDSGERSADGSAIVDLLDSSDPQIVRPGPRELC